QSPTRVTADLSAFCAFAPPEHRVAPDRPGRRASAILRPAYWTTGNNLTGWPGRKPAMAFQSQARPFLREQISRPWPAPPGPDPLIRPVKTRPLNRYDRRIRAKSECWRWNRAWHPHAIARRCREAWDSKP